MRTSGEVILSHRAEKYQEPLNETANVTKTAELVFGTKANTLRIGDRALPFKLHSYTALFTLD